MDNFIIALIVLLISTFVARILTEKANRKLDQQKKAELFDLFSKDRIWSFAILIGLLLSYFAAVKFSGLEPFMLLAIYFVLLLLYIVWLSYYTYIKLKRHNFPDEYNKSYIIATAVRLLGLAAFMLLMEIKF